MTLYEECSTRASEIASWLHVLSHQRIEKSSDLMLEVHEGRMHRRRDMFKRIAWLDLQRLSVEIASLRDNLRSSSETLRKKRLEKDVELYRVITCDAKVLLLELRGRCNELNVDGSLKKDINALLSGAIPYQGFFDVIAKELNEQADWLRGRHMNVGISPASLTLSSQGLRLATPTSLLSVADKLLHQRHLKMVVIRNMRRASMPMEEKVEQITQRFKLALLARRHSQTEDDADESLADESSADMEDEIERMTEGIDDQTLRQIITQHGDLDALSEVQNQPDQGSVADALSQLQELAASEGHLHHALAHLLHQLHGAGLEELHDVLKEKLQDITEAWHIAVTAAHSTPEVREGPEMEKSMLWKIREQRFAWLVPLAHQLAKRFGHLRACNEVLWAELGQLGDATYNAERREQVATSVAALLRSLEPLATEEVIKAGEKCMRSFQQVLHGKLHLLEAASKACAHLRHLPDINLVPSDGIAEALPSGPSPHTFVTAIKALIKLLRSDAFVDAKVFDRFTGPEILNILCEAVSREFKAALPDCFRAAMLALADLGEMFQDYEGGEASMSLSLGLFAGGSQTLKETWGALRAGARQRMEGGTPLADTPSDGFQLSNSRPLLSRERSQTASSRPWTSTPARPSTDDSTRLPSRQQTDRPSLDLTLEDPPPRLSPDDFPEGQPLDQQDLEFELEKQRLQQANAEQENDLRKLHQEEKELDERLAFLRKSVSQMSQSSEAWRVGELMEELEQVEFARQTIKATVAERQKVTELLKEQRSGVDQQQLLHRERAKIMRSQSLMPRSQSGKGKSLEWARSESRLTAIGQKMGRLQSELSLKRGATSALEATVVTLEREKSKSQTERQNEQVEEKVPKVLTEQEMIAAYATRVAMRSLWKVQSHKVMQAQQAAQIFCKQLLAPHQAQRVLFEDVDSPTKPGKATKKRGSLRRAATKPVRGKEGRKGTKTSTSPTSASAKTSASRGHPVPQVAQSEDICIGSTSKPSAHGAHGQPKLKRDVTQVLSTRRASRASIESRRSSVDAGGPMESVLSVGAARATTVPVISVRSASPRSSANSSSSSAADSGAESEQLEDATVTALRNEVQASLGEQELEKSNQWAEDWIRRKSMQDDANQEELSMPDGKHLLRRTGLAEITPLLADSALGLDVDLAGLDDSSDEETLQRNPATLVEDFIQSSAAATVKPKQAQPRIRGREAVRLSTTLKGPPVLFAQSKDSTQAKGPKSARSKPMDLPPERYPVPGDDEEVRRQLEQEEEQDFAAVENGSEERGRRRSRSRLGTPMAEMAFTTPESWMNQGAVTGGSLRTAGRMPEEGAEGSQARGGEPLRSQGAVFQADHGGDDLQREVEKEVVRTLQEENEQLRRKMQELMQKMEEKSGNSDWSEVSAGSPRLRKGAADRREEVRYTPNGTQVPTGPPPVTMEGDRPPVPPWPFPDWEVYEKDEGGHTRRMEIDSREWQLHRGLYGGGASSRHTDCGRGTGSRQEVRHQEVEGSLGDPQVDRERWLMRELVQLQQALDSEKRSKVRWRVDQEGHLREVPLSRADHHGRQGQVPLCRAGQPGKGEQAPLSRASYQGLNEGDRAWQPQHGDLRDNRAWQAQQADGGRDHRYRGEDPGVATGSGSQDQGGNHRTVELPELSGGDLTPLILGDWMEVVKPLMMDLSPQASRWWVLVVEESYRYYNEWRRATPMERLRISPESVVVRMDPTLHRTEQRGISLLLKAIPLSVKETVIAERLLSTTGILFTLLKNFQPGGSSERTLLLKELSEIKVGKSPNEACAAVRSWRRFYTRTKEIEATVPDPIILLRALEPAVQLISQLDAQATFRLAQSRAQLQVDARPEESSELSEIKVGKSPNEACAAVRSWRRFYTRTKEIEATVPDPIILLRALEPAVQLISQLDAQATFRLAQSRAQLQVDARPEESSVWSYSECLLAELESLRLLQGSTATSNSGSTATTTPAVKMLGTKSSTTSACKFWGSDTGCRQGKRCSYLHDWASLEDRNNRCFLCSSTAHRKADCPTRAVGESTNPTGGSGGGGPKGKGNGKNKSKTKPGGEESAASTKGKGNGNGAGSSTPQSSSGLQEASLKAMQGTGAPSSAESVAGSTTSKPESLATEKELMGEVASLLKTLRVGDGNSNPQLSAVRLARILNQDKAVLIDGGATHCLRNPHSREEYLNHAEEVRVDLAAGSVRMRQDTGTGTLYSEDPNLQPIVPLADVIKVGVVVKWDSSGCEMRYRSGEKLPVFLQDGCPMLPMQRGMELLYEVEEFNRRKMKLRRAVTHPQPDRDREEEFMSRLARLFPEVPLRILERVPGKLNYDNDIMAINRRTRRQVERAETVILNLFSGPNTKIWTSHGQKGLLILNVEVLKGTDLLESNFYGYLEAQARFGRFSAIYAGPPCKTVSFCRFGHDQDGGPPPLRAREGALRFGLPWISPEQQEEADIDSTLWIKTLWLIHLARGSRSDFLFMVEQPRDPKEWREDDYALHGGHGYPSFLCWPETDRVMIAYSDVIEVRVDQGALGHKRKKPTTLVTNIHEVKLMNGLQDNSVQRPWPTSLQARMEESRSLAEWAPELKNLLLSVAIRVHRGQPPLRLRTTVPRMNALTAAERKDMEMWQNHINQEHLPMRRDCHDCLLAMGRDRPRRRQVCPASYCLSIDVAGPFEPGVDQLAGNPRYFLIGCYTLPVSQGVALTEAIGKLGGQVKMTPLDEGEEKDGIVLGEYYDYHLEENEKALAELDQVDTYLAGMEQQMELQHEEEEERNIFSETELDPPRLASENVPNQEDVQAPEDPPQGELDGVFVERREKPEEALPEVLRAVSSIYVRLRGLGLPIYRLHSDRAREFTGKLMRDWILSHDMEHTTTAADESAGSGRVESEIAHLKHHTKLLLTTARAPPTYWPMALRHASEYRLRKTLEQLGVPVPRLIPFGTEAIAKSKFWHRTMKGFPTPMQKVKVWGPAVGMSLSSKGYWIEADGKWMRSTVVVQPGA
eukprot:symbB.v1.2.011127.t1/scaffold732.1/size241626/1